MLEASGTSRLLLYPSHKGEEAWRSLTREERERLWVAFDTSNLVRTMEHPLSINAKNRVGRLRGYGNAIVPPLAAAFLATVFDTLQDFDDA